MTKEVNEKTFELNITNELLTLSKSFIWYLGHFHWLPFQEAENRHLLRQFFNTATIFAEGLTQEEESNPVNGGYDVSINFRHPYGQEGRVMFLQFKAGYRKLYSRKIGSMFHRKNGNSEHVMFTFNDAAEGTQHSTLRNLANSTDVSQNSVLYVFPRITKKQEFINQSGNLVNLTSFVPVLEIDKQGLSQSPQVIVNDGIVHKYRTTYDGLTSEINHLLLQFIYDKQIVSEFIAELICIQIERFSKILKRYENLTFDLFLESLSENLSTFIEYELKEFSFASIVTQNVQSYINLIVQSRSDYSGIPQAPIKYTTIIPKEGLKLRFEDKQDKSSVRYQIF